jgi:PAS domain S-box-containing protein
MAETIHSLRFRLLCLVVAALIPALGQTLYGNWRYRQTSQQQWRSRCSDCVHFVERQEQELLQETGRMMTVLARTGPATALDLRSCRAMFSLMREHYPHFLEWGITDTNGRVQFSLPAASNRVSVASLEGFQRMSAAGRFSGFGHLTAPVARQEGLGFGMPIRNSAGEMRGVLYTVLGLNWFSDSASHLEGLLPEDTSFVQIDERGTILAACPAAPGWVGKRFPGASHPKELSPAAEGVGEGVDLNGRTAFVTSGSLPSAVTGRQLFYRLSVPKASLLAGANHALARSLLLSALAVILALAVAWYGGEWMVVRRVQNLVESVSQIEEGKQPSTLRIGGGCTELDHLAKALDRMAARLRERARERQRVEESLRESEQKYRALFDNSAVGVFLTKDGVVTDCNEQVCRLLGYPREEIIGFRSRKFFPTTQPDGRDSVEAAMELSQAAMSGTPQSFYWQALHKNGSLIDAEATLRTLSVHGQGLLLATIHDISEVRRAERALRDLSGRLLQLQDEERRHIARELHDHTAQWLAALAMNLTVLETTGGEKASPNAKILEESQGLLRQCLSEVRTLSYLLHPPLLEELGLCGAIEEYATGFAKRSGIQVHVQDLPDLTLLPKDVGLALFRVLQECLANIHRHSGSAYAYIRLMQDNSEVRLEVCDTGRGMAGHGTTDSANGVMARKFGVGITGMRERLRQLGGSLEIDSGRQGTTVRARVPLRRGIV